MKAAIFFHTGSDKSISDTFRFFGDLPTRKEMKDPAAFGIRHSADWRIPPDMLVAVLLYLLSMK